MDFFNYLAANRPNECWRVMGSFGCELVSGQVRTAEELSDCLRQFIYYTREEGLNSLAMIHPDYELITEVYREEKKKNKNKKVPKVIYPSNNNPMVYNNDNIILFMGAALIISAAIITLGFHKN